MGCYSPQLFILCWIFFDQIYHRTPFLHGPKHIMPPFYQTVWKQRILSFRAQRGIFLASNLQQVTDSSLRFAPFEMTFSHSLVGLSSRLSFEKYQKRIGKVEFTHRQVSWLAARIITKPSPRSRVAWQPQNNHLISIPTCWDWSAAHSCGAVTDLHGIPYSSRITRGTPVLKMNIRKNGKKARSFSCEFSCEGRPWLWGKEFVNYPGFWKFDLARERYTLHEPRETCYV
jgi:hypothetical protein